MYSFSFISFFNPYFMMMGHGGSHRVCNGAILLVFGVLFLLGTTGVWPEFTLMKYWPLVFIAMGLHKLFCSTKDECCSDMGKKK